jgi:hypothetical protein
LFSKNVTEVAAMHSVAPVELADDDPFRNHKLRVGDCVAVCFDEGLFFGIVQEILVRDSANRIVTFFGDMSLQNRPPFVKFRCAWLSEISAVDDRHPDDMSSDVPSFVLGVPDLYPSECLQFFMCLYRIFPCGLIVFVTFKYGTTVLHFFNS